MRLYDHLNKPLLLGEELGRGGEGSVYTIQGNTTNVAKIYHKPIATEKAEKLKAMVVNSLDLSSFTAWPLATLHDKSGSAVRGFIMPRVSGHREIHELYGPAHRKVQFPHADWAFLIYSARNVAVAFQAIHESGHTIGDVNQSGILISQQAVCRLIDTDSFQIRLGSKIYCCEVGTPHFTPPELQGKSFRGVLRKNNHDNFGLAIIIFQLLFMGRHPFAGRYLGSGDMPIERAIREYRFAFSSNASTKRMAPPPNALSLSVCTSSIAQFFERAFSEESAYKETRPTAQEWINQLDILRSELVSCNQNTTHKYYKNSATCPWCKLENESGIIYFLAYATAGSPQNKFDLDEVWSVIQSVKPPSLGSLPNIDSIRVTPIPLPDYAKPPTGILGFVNSIFNYHDDGGERNRRESVLRQEEGKWQYIQRQWQTLASDPTFSSVYQNLQSLFNEYKNLPKQYQNERNTALLNIYLDRYFIEKAEIQNIGKKRALVLASYGIETAADVSYDGISSVPGFGPVLTQNLVDWRKSLEVRFPKYKPSPRDLSALNSIEQKYARRQSELQSKLSNGKLQLEHARDALIKKHRKAYEEAEYAARKLAQARADIKVYV